MNQDFSSQQFSDGETGEDRTVDELRSPAQHVPKSETPQIRRLYQSRLAASRIQIPEFQSRVRSDSDESNEGVVNSYSDDDGPEKVLSSSISMSRQFNEGTKSI